MAWKFNPTEAVFVQIARHLQGEILKGTYLPDQQIPSVRQLATEAAVNPNTVQKALTLLEEEGLVCTRGTIGRFVTSEISVLDRAREHMRREMVARWLEEAEDLGLTVTEAIHYMQEEENK